MTDIHAVLCTWGLLVVRFIQRHALLSSTALVLIATSATAQDRESVFNLGEIHVVAPDSRQAGIGGSVVTREDIWTFQRPTLTDAVNLAPGVTSTLDSNGRRNESDIFVRGFGRWQVPLMIDGVRVYLPADNRLDFSRFLTADIAEIQIQKGYASVLDGPGAMGGIINLVSRKPTKPYEAEFQGGLSFGNRGFEGWNGYAMLGSRQENFYVQGSVNYFDRDFWALSDGYKPFPAQGAYAGSLQPAGRRINSDNRDWRINLKAGFTPNATDEYTISYIRQEGRKGGLLNVYNNPQQPPNSFWRWPQWNIQNLSFLSNTQLGDASYLKTKFYYNTFDNALYAYDDITYTSQTANGRFRSMYDDHAYGTSIEAGTQLIPMNTLKGAFHYRFDSHTEWQHARPGAGAPNESVEPKHTQTQTTWSVAAENTFHATSDFDLVAGISYDKYWIGKSEEFDGRAIFERPRGGASAFNWQAAAVWRYGATGQLHASVSSRARFPVIFELYSTRFGTAVPNPDLGPERAINYEIGWKEKLGAHTNVSAAVFYSDVKDLIQTVQIGGGLTQTQNVGNGHFAGAEFSFDTRLSQQLRAGGNYTYIQRTIKDALQPNLQATGVPTHKAFVYLAWNPIEKLTITPSLEIASARWSDVVIGTAAQNQAVRSAFPDAFIRTGAYTLLNLQAEYRFSKNFDVAAGVRNMLDQNYELSWGLPQQGRNYYFKARATF